jgi:hypothetical protein
MIRDAQRRAKRQRVPFSLQVEDIEIPMVCPVFGIPLFNGKGQAGDNSPTLDRIIPSLGYVPGNVLILSNRANRIKTDATPLEIYKVARFSEDLLRTYYA